MTAYKSRNACLRAGVSFILGLVGFCPLYLSAAPPAPQPSFTFQSVKELAHALAAKPFHPEQGPELPDSLKKLNYDTYNAIRFRPQEEPWAADHLRFGVQLFHRGYLYQELVRIHLIEANQVKEFPFSPRQFDYGKNPPALNPAQDLQFAGLRVLYSPTPSGKRDEVTAFLGGSYFRPIGLHQRYGSSARTVAVDTAEPAGEEFPRFTDFWLEKPGALANFIRLYALLDSRSLAGAACFVIKPGDVTVVEVQIELLLRKDVKKIGVAPFSSMFWFGKERTRIIPDFRPEVHDSDGLLIQTVDGQCIWRPLANPPKTHVVSRFPVAELRGFGLMQRERNFSAYEDLGARYDLRPSLWVEPGGPWAGGTIELVEIPTSSEFNDNIVAYWVPPQKPVSGQSYTLRYTLSTLSAEPLRTNLLRVISTRLNPEHDKTPVRFIIDFSGDTSSAPANGNLTADVHTSKGEVRNVVIQKNDVTGGWRTFFDLVGPGNDPAELQVTLKRQQNIISETWVYRYEKP